MPLPALSKYTRQRLAVGLGSQSAAKDLADIVDAGSGTLKVSTFRRVVTGMGDAKAAALLQTAVNAGSSISGSVQRKLALMVGDNGAAREIAAKLAE